MIMIHGLWFTFYVIRFEQGEKGSRDEVLGKSHGISRHKSVVYVIAFINLTSFYSFSYCLQTFLYPLLYNFPSTVSLSALTSLMDP